MLHGKTLYAGKCRVMGVTKIHTVMLHNAHYDLLFEYVVVVVAEVVIIMIIRTSVY
jgi:hypothetical protein